MLPTSAVFWDYIDDETLKSHILGLPKDESDAVENVKSRLCRSDADHHDKLLACGVLIMAELRQQVLKETEFTCSVGIAYNTMLKQLGGKLGDSLQNDLGVNAVGELLQYSSRSKYLDELMGHIIFPSVACWK